MIGETLFAILGLMKFELLGLKIIDGPSEIYTDDAPKDVQNLVRFIAKKFHEFSSEESLKKKINSFKTLALVLRGQNVEAEIDSVYDRERLKFRAEIGDKFEDVAYEGSPQAIFLTNFDSCDLLLKHLHQRGLVKLFQDFKENFEHLNNSFDFYQGVYKPLIESMPS